jgi:hypothetical protein
MTYLDGKLKIARIYKNNSGELSLLNTIVINRIVATIIEREFSFIAWKFLN